MDAYLLEAGKRCSHNNNGDDPFFPMALFKKMAYAFYHAEK